MEIARKDIDRFWSKVAKTDNCWIWLGGKFTTGYGLFKLKGKNRYAHRIAWEITNGSPEDAFLCHKCDNRMCVNPGHIFLGTQADNVKDCINKGRRRYTNGSKHGMAKLNEYHIRDIRLRYETGEITQLELATEYCVSFQHISDIINKKKWRFLT